MVLDAAARLPMAVDHGGNAANTLAVAIGQFTDFLTSGMMAPTEVATHLEALGQHAISSAPRPPSVEASAEATKQFSEGLRSVEIDERIRYDEFFGVRRVAQIDADSLAATTLWSVSATLSDLAATPVGIHELVALTRGMRLLTEWIDPAAMDSVTAGAGQLITAEFTDAERAMARFRLGHLIFALYCDFAHHHLELARASIAQGDSGAEKHLGLATVCVRASTAAMWYSTSFPRTIYAEVVRPPMDAASTRDHGFSGLDNFDFRRMREGWEDLADALSEHAALLQNSPSLGSAARGLFEIIVEDNEHHVLIAAEALGVAPSLRSERMGHSAVNHGGVSAVAALRLNLQERLALLEAVESASGRRE